MSEPDVLAVLAGLDHPHEIFDCDPALADTAAFCEAYGFAMEDSANVYAWRQIGRYSTEDSSR